MATLVEKIKSARPNVTDADFVDNIIVKNNSDGNGDFIDSWNHPTETQPTAEELA
tara:strand:- start:13 stop:177 length:165 start_codon:yes stop_codon:yes gene_type:complete